MRFTSSNAAEAARTEKTGDGKTAGYAWHYYKTGK